VADAWMPNTRCIRSGSDGGQMQGGAPRVVWLTLDTAPHEISAISAAQRLNEEGRPCHLVWDPMTGSIAQLLPVVRAGRALGTREHIYYEPAPPCGRRDSALVNREGRLCVQIAVLSSAREPFTSSPMLRLGDILGWLDSWQIPRRWPAGQPAGSLEAEHRKAERVHSRALWARGGHYGASQVPDCNSTGPGSIDIEQLTGAGTPRRRGEPSPVARSETALSEAALSEAAAAIRLDRRNLRDLPPDAALEAALAAAR
jgi:hypothetical protein